MIMTRLVAHALTLASTGAGVASAFTTPGITGATRALRVVASPAMASSSSSSALRMVALEGLPGALPPMGVWDPLGLATEIDDTTFAQYRSAELKHGRVAMLATVGMFVQEMYHPFFPAPGVGDIGPAINHFQIISTYYPLLGIAAMFLMGLIESIQIRKEYTALDRVTGLATVSADAAIGDLGFDPFNIKSDETKYTTMRNKELNNGRLAMLAITGMWAQELVNGHELIVNIGLSLLGK